MVTTQPEASVPDASTSSVDPGPKELPRRPLDIVFLQDSTGSQGPYIQSAREAIKSICEKVSLSTALSQGAIRFGLVAFRDHPPQDNSFVTKNFGFTSEVDKMKQNLGGMIASGGGDGPEASTAAMAEALNMEWAENAVKICVLITDAPPHGLGETGDGFPNGSPDQNDPLEIARQMAEHGVTLYVIACEPSLSRYKHAVDFYRALTQITGGRMVPLVNAAQLGDYIVGSAIETLETEQLLGQFEKVILEDVYGQGKSVEEVMDNIQAELNNRNVQMQTLCVEDIYHASEVADKNMHVWGASASLSSARGKVKEVEGSRVKAEYLGGSTGGLGSGGPGSSGGFGSMLTGWGGATKSRKKAKGDLAMPAAPPPPPGAPSLAAAAPTPYAAAPTLYAAAPTLYGAAPTPAAPVVPAVSMVSQAVDRSQAKRLVMQGLMRNAKVGPGGVLTPKGAYADKGPTSIDGL